MPLWCMKTKQQHSLAKTNETIWTNIAKQRTEELIKSQMSVLHITDIKIKTLCDSATVTLNTMKD